MNMSILDRNIIDSFGAFDDAEGAEKIFLRLRDKTSSLDAERSATAWGRISGVIVQGVRGAQWIHGAQDEGVLEFTRERFLNKELRK